jgi:hypothetical protein
MSRGEIFVSYVDEDISLARRAKKQFEAYGWSAFLASDDIRPSENWRDEILAHINSCSALIAIVTPRTTQSAWMNQEVGIAMGKGKRIISLIFGRSEDLPSFLKAIQGISANEDDVSDAVRKAQNAINELPQRSRTPPQLEQEKDFTAIGRAQSTSDLDKQKFVVYFDENYPNSFIGYDAGRKLASDLARRGFSIVDAAQLGTWIRGVVSQGIASQTSLVFAMDIVPEEIFGDVDANVPLRKYLDAGGRVTWMGDIPAWSKGKSGRKRDEVWQFGSFVCLFGICPVIASCVRPIELTSRGRELGLTSPWYSSRPVVVMGIHSSVSAKSALSNETIYVLAWTKVTQGNYVFNPPKRISWLRKITLQIPGLVGAEIVRNDDNKVHNVRCASAWHMVFNTDHPQQGFFRFWDYSIHLDDLTSTRLQEIYDVATKSLPNA